MTRQRATPAGLLLADTSVAVALCSADHPRHRAAIRCVGDRPLGLAGHAWFETFSVLTRLPPPGRRSPQDVISMMRENFPETVFISAAEQHSFTLELPSLTISGGAIYDALVALAVRKSGASLITADRRALPTYRLIDIPVALIE